MASGAADVNISPIGIRPGSSAKEPRTTKTSTGWKATRRNTIRSTGDTSPTPSATKRPSFISRHAGEDEPFFLYMTPTAPHTPWGSKQQDIAHFCPCRRTGAYRFVAAMQYALDRNVGKVLAAIDDPNGDGNTSDSVRDNTIIVFINDNGGTNVNDNTPFAGNKGLTWEGGIRMPFMIHIPGVEPGVYDKPVIGYDILPTVYAAAGGNVAQLNSDGVNLKPYFHGRQPKASP